MTQLWLESKISLAEDFFSGKCGATYQEGAILLSALLSGVSAALWPGIRIDRRRFVETLITYGHVSPSPTQISVPLLFSSITDPIMRKALLDAYPGLNQTALAVTETDIDADESQIPSACAGVKIRDQSYANLLYTEIRCGYSHEFKLSARASQNSSSSRPAAIKYDNRLDRTTGISSRLIHFDAKWILDVAREVVKNTASMIEAAQTLPQPSIWWIDK